MKNLIIFLLINLIFYTCQSFPRIIGASVNDLKGISMENGVYQVSTAAKIFILFGNELKLVRSASFSHLLQKSGEDCAESKFPVKYKISLNETKLSAYMEYFKSEIVPRETLLYLCLEVEEGDKIKYIHQGDAVVFSIVFPHRLMPLWASIILSIILVVLSGMFSGLNLGLMSLTPRELNLIISTGTKSERHNARAVLPLRKKGNVLLCAILFGNTIVNSTTAIILENMTSGIVAVVVTTFIIVIFGEVIPQSICARYGLLIGAKTRYFSWFVIFLTLPLCYPLGKLLDFIIGHETPIVYNRNQLLEVVRLNCEGNLEADEAGIIFGALKFKSKTVYDIMTPLEQCFMVNENSVLNFKTISDIVKSGYSRIPVYSNFKVNIIGLLHIKDLAFIDPDDTIPLSSVLNFYSHALIKVFYDTKLDVVFQEFKKGLAHLGIVIKIKYPEGVDPIYEAIGIITLEDIIEEIIQSEISDETDIISPDVDKTNLEVSKNINKHHIRQFFENSSVIIPQLTHNMILTICQFMSSEIKIFDNEHVSLNILRRMIAHPGVAIKRDFVENYFLYKTGVPVDYYILIIEGRVEVTIGSEKLTFVQGPLSYYGHLFLEKVEVLSSRSVSEKQKTSFIPDFSLRITTDVVFLKINYSLYKIAVEATKLEKTRKQSGEKTDDIWDKIAPNAPLLSDTPLPSTPTHQPDIIIISNEIKPTP